MSKLTWHNAGDNEFESGVEQVALFVMSSTSGVYNSGVAWNGVTEITENPSGADITDLYADDVKYASLQAAEKYGLGIGAYTYPDEWMACDGSESAVTGVYVGQQPRTPFGLVWITKIGDESHPGLNKGSKLHIAYNLIASPSSRSYSTINENPDAITMSWDANSTGVACTGYKDISTITVDQTQITAANWTTLISKLYGTDGTGGSTGTDPTLPDPATLLGLIGWTAPSGT